MMPFARQDRATMDLNPPESFLYAHLAMLFRLILQAQVPTIMATLLEDFAR